MLTASQSSWGREIINDFISHSVKCRRETSLDEVTEALGEGKPLAEKVKWGAGAHHSETQGKTFQTKKKHSVEAGGLGGWAALSLVYLRKEKDQCG